MTAKLKRLVGSTCLATAILSATPAWADIDTKTADNNGQLPLPTGQFVTPTFITGANQQFLNPGLANYPDYVAGIASRSVVSPDGSTLLIITNGYNLLFTPAGAQDPAGSNQYVFVYDISGAHKAVPALRQVIPVTNIYQGVVWAGSKRFYVSGGVDDVVRAYDLTGTSFVNTATIPLNHNRTGIGFSVSPNAAGLALSGDGSQLVVANMFNDSISVIATATNTVSYEYDLRPFHTSGQDGVAGGEQPYFVAVAGVTAYVASLRDREIVAIDISGPAPRFVTRIAVPGAPNGIAASAAGDRLYVSQDLQDAVSVIDTATNAVIEQIDARAPAGVIPAGPRYTGTAPNSVTLSPDGRTLYVTNGGANSVAIIGVSGAGPHSVAALVPTGWFPQSVTLSADGTQLYIVNGKSDQGPNPGHLTGTTTNFTTVTYPGGNKAAAAAAQGSNQYQLQLHRSALVSAPVPVPGDYAALTNQVAANDFYAVAPVPSDTATMAALHEKIQHVIYIIKENRTYDQVLGDLTNGADGDPTLAVFGKRITPSLHRLATNFVTLDNFFDPADASMNGWSWSTQANATDQEEKSQQINYAGRGLSYDTEGQMRNIDVGRDLASREAVNPRYAAAAAAVPGGAANLLPGVANVGITDGPDGVFQGGLIWEAALRAGLTVRDYGCLVGNLANAPSNTIRDPFTNGTPVVYAHDAILGPITDTYFRGGDTSYPDVWREEEWAREFNQFEQNGALPNFEIVRLPGDHMGSFGSHTGGFNTPEQQQADNDLAVGRLVEAVAHSPRYASNTLIFIVEDDTQDGPDHLDSHRSTTYVVGPYVRQNAVVSTRYTTVNLVRTMEDVLGTGHLNLNDALQRPMADVFDLNQANWTFNATASTVLRSTQTSLTRDGETPQFAEGPDVTPAHDAAYWAKATQGFDFSDVDRVPAGLFNEVLWEGLGGGRPYPVERSGKHLGRTH